VSTLFRCAMTFLSPFMRAPSIARSKQQAL
jgi:hypothetical protein